MTTSLAILHMELKGYILQIKSDWRSNQSWGALPTLTFLNCWQTWFFRGHSSSSSSSSIWQRGSKWLSNVSFFLRWSQTKRLNVLLTLAQRLMPIVRCSSFSFGPLTGCRSSVESKQKKYCLSASWMFSILYQSGIVPTSLWNTASAVMRCGGATLTELVSLNNPLNHDGFWCFYWHPRCATAC